jgi:Tol biopolymer transport system component
VSYVLRWFELLPPILQEVTMPAATTDRSSSASISADGRVVAFTSDADNLVAGDGNFDTDIFVHDRQTQTTVRSSVRSDGTETGFEVGSLNAALSADGQVVAFESEGHWWLRMAVFPWTSSCTTSSPSRLGHQD